MRRGAFIIISGYFSLTVFGGQLDDFEKQQEASAPPAQVSTQSRSSNSSSYSSSSDHGNNFLGDLLLGLAMAPFRIGEHDSVVTESADDEEGWADEDSIFPKHFLGAPTMPYVRVDYNWQWIDSNLDAQDFRVEAGYKLVAFHARHTLYTESNPSDELTLNQYYGVLRFGGTLQDILPGSFEVGLGLGMVQQQGNEEHSGGAITIPIKFYPTEWFGLEFRPAWYEPQERAIGDYDFSACLGSRFIQFRGGYRWLWVQGKGHFLNGPYAGVSVSF